LAASCGGDAFNDADTAGGGAVSAAGNGHVSVGATAGDAVGGSPQGEAGATVGNAAGALSDGGGSSENAGAPSTGAAGAGHVFDDAECQRLLGSPFADHCYVDTTTVSVNQQEAVDACASFASEVGVPGHLLVLETAEEQTFILKQFMAAFTDKSDAWLGLTCSELDWPDINDCFCASSCSKAVLTEKQKAWSWLGNVQTNFGWVNGNPNAAFRCAALGYNPETTIWGWVDRSCATNAASPISGHPHEYRAICELEP